MNPGLMLFAEPSPSLPNRTRGFLFGAVSAILQPMTEEPIKTVAARVLGDPEAQPDHKRLAGYVLGDLDDARTTNDQPIKIPGNP